MLVPAARLVAAASAIALCRCSSVSVDWSSVRPADLRVAYWRIRYTPPVGRPASGSRLPAHVNSARLNDTVAGTDYTVSLSAVTDAFRPAASELLVYERTVFSTPDAPRVQRLAVRATGATLTLVAPDGDNAADTTYRVEYGPVKADDQRRSIDSASHMISLSNLSPGTDYSARVSSIVRGAVSDDANFVTFTTDGMGRGDMGGNALGADTTAGSTGRPALTAIIPWPALVTGGGGAPTTTGVRPSTPASATSSTRRTTTTSTRRPPPAGGTTGFISWFAPTVQQQRYTPLWTKAATTSARTTTTASSSSTPWTTTTTTTKSTAPTSNSTSTESTTTTTGTNRMSTSRSTTTTSTMSTLPPIVIDREDRPSAVARLRVADARTDERAKSSVRLDFRWPHTLDADLFDLVLTYASSQGRHMRALSGRSPVVIDGLYPATRYTFTVVNVTKTGLKSEPTSAAIVTPPAIESEVRAGRISVTGATVIFTSTPHKHTFDHYALVVSGVPDGDNITRVVPRDDTLETNHVDVEGLKAGSKYTTTLYTVYKDVHSAPVVASFKTYPLHATHLLVVVRQREADLHWSSNHADKPHVKYRLAYRGTDADETRTTYVSGRTVHRVRGLKPATWYTFTLTTIMEDIESDAVSMTAVTTPTDVQAPQVSRYDEREMAVRYRADMFPYLNGNIANYSVIIASTRAISDLVPYPAPTWQQVQARRYPWPAYQSSRPGYNPFGDSNAASARATATIFYVGTQYCLTADQHVYCNGPLKAEYEYAAKVRACCAGGTVCMESDYVTASADEAHWLDKERRKQTRYRTKTTTPEPTTPRSAGKGLNRYFSNFWILRNAKYNAAGWLHARHWLLVACLLAAALVGRRIT